MSATIQFGYQKSASGDISVVASMDVSGATDIEVAYARQGMVYVHRLLESNLDDLNTPHDLQKIAKVVLVSGIPEGNDNEFGAEDVDVRYGATAPKARSESSRESEGNLTIAVCLYFDTDFEEIGCLNEAHIVVAKSAYEMLSEAIKTVTV
ncbi:MAG: hypothetical protein RSG77_17840 [Hafnia sp.]